MSGPGAVPADHRDRYEADMRSAGVTWASTIEALRGAEVPAFITQTGGMCLAIEFPTPDGGHVWLTDSAEPLPWDRCELEGWYAGWYPNGDESCEPVLGSDSSDLRGSLHEDVFDETSDETAVAVCMELIGRIRIHLQGSNEQ